MPVIDQLLSEKLRPKKIEDIILLPRIKKSLGNTDELNQNLLLSGIQGSGKSSTAHILSNGHPKLYLNMSLDRGIDIVREEITQFCSTQSLIFEKSPTKYIILDELDGASVDFFKALRATMEKFHMVRFIGTCNYLAKIPDPIKSRFLLIDFNPIVGSAEEEGLKTLYKNRIVKVCKKLGMEWESDEVLDLFLKMSFPDLRTIFNKIQDLHTRKTGIIRAEDIKSVVYSFTDIFNLMLSKPKPYDDYKLIMTDYQNKLNDIIVSITQEFPSWLKQNNPAKMGKLPQILIATAEWDTKKTSMIDPILALLALVYQSQQIFNT